MKRTTCHLLILLAALPILLLASGHLMAQTTAPAPGSETLTFTFAPGNDLFTLRGNEAQLDHLFSLIDRHRDAITAHGMPLHVDGYCASLPTPRENLRTAYLRASRVKSELITRKGLTEADFVTGNYAHAFDNQPDVVVVTLHIPPSDTAALPDTAVILSDSAVILSDSAVIPSDSSVIPSDSSVILSDSSVILSEAKDLQPQSTDPEMLHSATNDRKEIQHDKAKDTPLYLFALRTNLLYDALLLPTLGVEWRINRNVGIKLDGSLSRWGSSTGKVQKIWLLSPELRCYLLADRRFYVGVSGNYGEYNIYQYPLGSLFRDDTGYQGHLWSAGLSAGYQLRLCRHLSLDFNLGLGYTRSEYDSFTVTDGSRISRRRDKSKSFWGPTQAGISLVWMIGEKK